MQSFSLRNIEASVGAAFQRTEGREADFNKEKRNNTDAGSCSRGLCCHTVFEAAGLNKKTILMCFFCRDTQLKNVPVFAIIIALSPKNGNGNDREAQQRKGAIV